MHDGLLPGAARAAGHITAISKYARYMLRHCYDFYLRFYAGDFFQAISLFNRRFSMPERALAIQAQPPCLR